MRASCTHPPRPENRSDFHYADALPFAFFTSFHGLARAQHLYQAALLRGMCAQVDLAQGFFVLGAGDPMAQACESVSTHADAVIRFLNHKHSLNTPSHEVIRERMKNSRTACHSETQFQDAGARKQNVLEQLL